MMQFDRHNENNGAIGWIAPSNIALIKYWGKKERQIPCNPSLSLTLNKSVSKTIVEYKKDSNPTLEFFFNRKKEPVFEKRVVNYYDSVKSSLSYSNEYSLKIKSENTFPHSAGIASSASFFSSLALCLLSLDHIVRQTKLLPDSFYREASGLARLGSGSACRSVYGPYALWGKTKDKVSANEYAVKLSTGYNPSFDGMKDAILIVSSEKKSVSSSKGHSLMNQHPYAEKRFKSAKLNLDNIQDAMINNEQEKFIDIVENEALTLHAMMLTSNPSYILMHPNTLHIINRIRNFRRRIGIFMCFTLDAGPNIHLLYHKRDFSVIKDFIISELSPYLENKRWIDDEAGKGPELLNL